MQSADVDLRHSVKQRRINDAASRLPVAARDLKEVVALSAWLNIEGHERAKTNGWHDFFRLRDDTRDDGSLILYRPGSWRLCRNLSSRNGKRHAGKGC